MEDANQFVLWKSIASEAKPTVHPDLPADIVLRHLGIIVAAAIKAILARFGIRSFKPSLRKGEHDLEVLRTAEGTRLPDKTRAELRPSPREAMRRARADPRD